MKRKKKKLEGKRGSPLLFFRFRLNKKITSSRLRRGEGWVKLGVLFLGQTGALLFEGWVRIEMLMSLWVRIGI